MRWKTSGATREPKSQPAFWAQIPQRIWMRGRRNGQPMRRPLAMGAPPHLDLLPLREKVACEAGRMRGRAKIQSRSAFDLVNAQDALARSRPADAQRLINRVAEIAKEELPSPRVLVEINLTSALVAIYNADGPLALASAEMALTQLQAGQERWSTADRSYLIAYAQALIAYCEDWRDGGPALRHAHVKDLDLNQVSGHLKQKFPMPSSGAFGLKLDKVQPWRASA